jgi:hypothetical protein
MDIVGRPTSDECPSKFSVISKRWIVERTFSWLENYRRIAIDCEYSSESAEASASLDHTIHALLIFQINSKQFLKFASYDYIIPIIYKRKIVFGTARYCVDSRTKCDKSRLNSPHIF